MKYLYNFLLPTALLLPAAHTCSMHAAEQSITEHISQPISAQEQPTITATRNMLSNDAKKGLDNILKEALIGAKDFEEWERTHIPTIRTLLRAGANPLQKNNSGEPLLFRATLSTDVDAVLVMADLIEAGANPDEQNDIGWTPLMRSTSMLNINTVEMLLKRNVNAQLKGTYRGEIQKITALDIARDKARDAHTDEEKTKAITIAKLVEEHNLNALD